MQIENPPLPANKEDAGPTLAESAGMTRQALRVALEQWGNAFLKVLPAFLISRCIFVILTYFGVLLFTLPNYSLRVLPAQTLVDAWYRWDAIRYATIAAQGYKSLDYAAFFPLYPWLEHAVGVILHNHFFVAGLLISNLAFLGALVVYYRLVEQEFDAGTAGRTVLYLSIYPTALFFFTAYNESLFLLLLLLVFYTLRRGLWWPAGLLGGLATMTRSLGLVLVLIFFYEFVRQVFPRLRQAWHERQRWFILRKLANLPAVLLIPAGLGIYALYLNGRFHDPLAFSHAEVYWHQPLSGPWVTFRAAIHVLRAFSPFTFDVAHDLISLISFFLFLTLLILCFIGRERFSASQWSMLLFAAIALIYPTLFPGFQYSPMPSMERYVLEAFPCFILLARLGKRPWFHQNYLLLALPLLAFFTLQFLTGHWTI